MYMYIYIYIYIYTYMYAIHYIEFDLNSIIVIYLL